MAGNPELVGRHCRFWVAGLIEKSSDKQVAELLDHLAEQFPHLRLALDVRHLNDLPLKLLARGLKTHGDQIEQGRLYDWLGVGLLSRVGYNRYVNLTNQIRAWLGQRPDLQKTVIKEGLSRHSEADDVRRYTFNVQEHLYGGSLPSDFGHWCLEQAITLADTKTAGCRTTA